MKKKPDHDDRPVFEDEPITQTDPAPPPSVEWHEYKLRKSHVFAALVNGKGCRVQELGDGYHSVEVDGVEPLVTEECRAVCLVLAEKSAWTGRRVRRVVSNAGEESYQ